MDIRFGGTTPDFYANATVGKCCILGNRAFFFSYTGNLTPVCTTEIRRTAQLVAEFAKHHIQLPGPPTGMVKECPTWIDGMNDRQTITSSCQT